MTTGLDCANGNTGICLEKEWASFFVVVFDVPSLDAKISLLTSHSRPTAPFI